MLGFGREARLNRLSLLGATTLNGRLLAGAAKAEPIEPVVAPLQLSLQTRLLNRSLLRVHMALQANLDSLKIILKPVELFELGLFAVARTLFLILVPIFPRFLIFVAALVLARLLRLQLGTLLQ